MVAGGVGALVIVALGVGYSLTLDAVQGADARALFYLLAVVVGIGAAVARFNRPNS